VHTENFVRIGKKYVTTIERILSLSRWVLFSSHLLPWSARRFGPALLCRPRLRLCVTSSLFSNAAHRAVCT